MNSDAESSRFWCGESARTSADGASDYRFRSMRVRTAATSRSSKIPQATSNSRPCPANACIRFPTRAGLHQAGVRPSVNDSIWFERE